MKSSKMENLLDYEPPLENQTTAFYKAFQSGFDPGFGLPTYQTPYQLHCDSSLTDAPTASATAARKPFHGDASWSGSSLTPSCGPVQPTTSTSPWGEVTKRIVSNSTWITPATAETPKPPPGLALEGSSVSGALGDSEAYNQFQPNYASSYEDLCSGRSSSSIGLEEPHGSSVGLEEPQGPSVGRLRESSARLGMLQSSSLRPERQQDSSLWLTRLQEFSLGFGRLEEPPSSLGRAQESGRVEGSSYGFRRAHKSPLESRRLEEHPMEGSGFGLEWNSNQAQRYAGHQERYYPLILNQLSWNIAGNKCKTGGHNRPMVCSFCKNNKEVPDIYLSHYLYDPETKILTCPVLRKHVCEICGGTGDQAHTLRFCPMNRGKEFQTKIPLLLKTRTITDSTGKIRRN